jgi:hypothetical protein
MGEPNQRLCAARRAMVSPVSPGVVLSRSELAEMVNAAVFRHTGRVAALDGHYVAKLERGVIGWPGVEYRRALRDVLSVATDADLGFHRPRRGADTAPPLLGATLRAGNETERERLARVLAGEDRVDWAVVGHLADMLATQRWIERWIGSARALPATLAQIDLAEHLTRQAGSGLRPALIALVAEYHLLAGWMSDESGDHRAALDHHDRAIHAGHEIDDPTIVASGFGFKSHLAWGVGDAAGVIDLARAGQRDCRRLSPGVRGALAQMQARGHALHSDHAVVDRLINKTERLTDQAHEHPENEPGWVYFQTPDRVGFQRAIAYTELGRHRDAGELLTTAQATLLTADRRDHGRCTARLAVARAHCGDLPAALTAGWQALAIALDTGSATTIADLQRLYQILEDRHTDPAILDEFATAPTQITPPEPT